MKQTVALYFSMISIMFGGDAAFQQRRRRAKAQRKHRQPAQPEGKGQRRRADKHILGRDAQNLFGIAIGDDQQIAVEMHRCLGRSRWCPM